MSQKQKYIHTYMQNKDIHVNTSVNHAQYMSEFFRIQECTENNQIQEMNIQRESPKMQRRPQAGQL